MKKYLYYIHDPMCAWCYAFSKTFDDIKSQLDESFEICYIPGGLAPHTKETMPKPLQERIQSYWYEIEKVTGTHFNHDFWSKCTPRRSTYLSCQASLAARLQGQEEAMIKSIQDAYYQKAKNPSDKETLIELASNLNLDVEKFTHDLESKAIIELFEEELNKRRKMGVNSFPTLLLQYKKELYPIQIFYNEPNKMLDQIKNLSENIYF